MRIYDPRVGRFLSVDPITKEYPELTPYQFASNRPIDGIDQDGLEFEWAQNLWDKTKAGYEIALKKTEEGYVKSVPYVKVFGRGLEKAAKNLAPIRPAEEGDPKTLREAYENLKSIPSNLAKLPSQLSEVYRNGTTEEQIEASTTLLETLGGILKGKAGGIGGVEGVALAGLNWSWKSVKTFGHTFMEHGATVKLLSLADRARSKGFGIGQWTDNAKASEFLKDIYGTLKDGENIVTIPAGIGRVVNADKSVIEATKAIIIKNSEGATNAIKTAYPIQ